jgi:hypothetical protein
MQFQQASGGITSKLGYDQDSQFQESGLTGDALPIMAAY